MGARLEIPPFVPEQRWLVPYNFAQTGTSQTATAGRVYLLEFEVIVTQTVNGVNIVNGTTAAGNVIAGIYGPIVTEETCEGAPVLVESASTAVSGTSTPQIIPLTATTIRPGRYYVAVQYSNATNTFLRQSNSPIANGWVQVYDRGGGYGALTNPCPVTSNLSTNFPVACVRCSA